MEIIQQFLMLIWIWKENSLYQFLLIWNIFFIFSQKKYHYYWCEMPFLKCMSILRSLFLISCLCFVKGIPISFGSAMKNSCCWIFRLFSVKSGPISFADTLKDFCADYFFIWIGRCEKCRCKKDYGKDYCSNERKKLKPL